MESLLAFAAALLTLRLAASLLRRWRERRAPHLAVWAASLAAYALAAAALAWGAAAGWNEASFRLYYVCGGLLTAPLLGAGSLLLIGHRWALPLVLLYAGVAAGVGTAAQLTSAVAGASIPEAQDHLELVPARIVAIVGNSIGTAAVVAVALLTIRRRPLGNTLIVAGVAAAAAGSAVAGLGVAESAAFVAGAAILLYLGFLAQGKDSVRAAAIRARRR